MTLLPLLNKRILVVEDAADNRYLYVYMLEEFGAVVEEAENGSAALSLIKSKPYDLVLMDIKMPVMDGYQVMDELKSFKKCPPVVALTAIDTLSDEKPLSQYGFCDCIHKPIDPYELISRLKRVLQI